MADSRETGTRIGIEYPSYLQNLIDVSGSWALLSTPDNVDWSIKYNFTIPTVKSATFLKRVMFGYIELQRIQSFDVSIKWFDTWLENLEDSVSSDYFTKKEIHRIKLALYGFRGGLYYEEAITKNPSEYYVCAATDFMRADLERGFLTNESGELIATCFENYGITILAGYIRAALGQKPMPKNYLRQPDQKIIEAEKTIIQKVSALSCLPHP